MVVSVLWCVCCFFFIFGKIWLVRRHRKWFAWECKIPQQFQMSMIQRELAIECMYDGTNNFTVVNHTLYFGVRFMRFLCVDDVKRLFWICRHINHCNIQNTLVTGWRWKFFGFVYVATPRQRERERLKKKYDECFGKWLVIYIRVNSAFCK